MTPDFFGITSRHRANTAQVLGSRNASAQERGKILGCWVRVQDSGFGIQDLGFWVEDLGFRIRV